MTTRPIRLLPTLAAASLAAAAIVSAPVRAQQVFRGGADVVSLNVTVTDAESHLVPGLDRGDFQVFEDGVLQEITTFSREPQPIALSLLLDTSASMERKLPVAQQAATGFAKRLGPHDVAQIIDFDSRVEVLQPFTNDFKLLDSAIHRTRAGGSTSLYNALYIGLSALKEIRAQAADQIRRQAIVVLSDGEDTSSVEPYEEVLNAAKRSEVAVYAIGLKSKDDGPMRGFNEADFVLRTLSQETGGRVYFVDEVAQLPSIYQQIADELANQYSMGYTSKNPKRDGAWRRIVVRTTKGGLTTRTKSGYFGPVVR